MIPLPLHIDCPNELNQPYHPSIIYRESGFLGHKFWMAQTPYPITDRAPYRDRYENPCIYHSENGIHWIPANNPLDDLTKQEISEKCYFSDPHLVIRENQLELFYRFSDKDGIITLYKRITTDGVNWSERICVIDMHHHSSLQTFGKDFISPAIIWTDSVGYECWYVDDTFKNPCRKIRYTKSKDGICWEISTECQLKGNIVPWHIDVQKINEDLIMLVYDVDHQRIDWYEGDDVTHWHFVSNVLVPSGRRGDFYECGLYRACLIRVHDVYRIYFSAHNKIDSSIGVLETKDKIHFSFVSGGSWLDTIRFTLYVRYKALRRIVKRILR